MLSPGAKGACVGMCHFIPAIYSKAGNLRCPPVLETYFVLDIWGWGKVGSQGLWTSAKWPQDMGYHWKADCLAFLMVYFLFHRSPPGEDPRRLDCRLKGLQNRPFKTTSVRLQGPSLDYYLELQEMEHTVVKIKSRRTEKVYGTWGQFPTQK